MCYFEIIANLLLISTKHSPEQLLIDLRYFNYLHLPVLHYILSFPICSLFCVFHYLGRLGIWEYISVIYVAVVLLLLKKSKSVALYVKKKKPNVARFLECGSSMLNMNAGQLVIKWCRELRKISPTPYVFLAYGASSSGFKDQSANGR